MRKVCPCCGRSRGQQRDSQKHVRDYPRITCQRCRAINEAAEAEAITESTIEWLTEKAEAKPTLTVRTFPSLVQLKPRTLARIARMDAEIDELLTCDALQRLNEASAFVFGTGD